LCSKSDELPERLPKAGLETGERVWRMPLGPEYDKQIDSQFADMKNTGGRNGGSITAAQFLQRFVDGTPWAHLDIAGTAMGAPKNEINQSWGSGFGVRLLDRLVAEHYETKRGRKCCSITCKTSRGRMCCRRCSKNRSSAAGGSSCNRRRKSAPRCWTHIYG